jgi:signal transduction histidine kinase
MVSAAIWMLVASVFLLDLLTPADDVSVCFAYVIPIVASLLEARPRPTLYASVSSSLSILGMFFQPPTQLITVVMVFVAVLTQGLIAVLIRLQLRRLVEAQERAESQRRFVDILSHEVGTALTR